MCHQWARYSSRPGSWSSLRRTRSSNPAACSRRWLHRRSSVPGDRTAADPGSLFCILPPFLTWSVLHRPRSSVRYRPYQTLFCHCWLLPRHKGDRNHRAVHFPDNKGSESLRLSAWRPAESWYPSPPLQGFHLSSNESYPSSSYYCSLGSQ